MLQQFNQIDTEIQQDNINPENSHMIPSTSKNLPEQQVTRSEFSIPLPFVLHIMTERQERALLRELSILLKLL